MGWQEGSYNFTNRTERARYQDGHPTWKIPMITEEANVRCMQAAGRVQNVEKLAEFGPSKKQKGGDRTFNFSLHAKFWKGEKPVGSRLGVAESKKKKPKRFLPPELEVCCSKHAIPPHSKFSICSLRRASDLEMRIQTRVDPRTSYWCMCWQF